MSMFSFALINIYVRDQPFYFEIKDLITQFVAAFNSVVINRYDKNRVPDAKKLRVSYVYSPKQRVIQDLVNMSMHITLPVIAVTIGGVARDNSRVFNKILGSFYANNGSGSSDFLPQPVPINITVNMSILTKFQTDMDQILSNFVPYNNPYIIISWKVPDAFVAIPQEIRSEVLWSESVNMTYPTDIDSSTPYRVSADTSFTIKGWLFPKSQGPANNIFVIDTNFIPVSGFEIE
jgi:hypothetical protein